jgi:hypothetical protein
MSQVNYGRSKHGHAQKEVRKIKESLSRKYGKNAETLIDREILAALNRVDKNTS